MIESKNFIPSNLLPKAQKLAIAIAKLDLLFYDVIVFHAPCPDGFGAAWGYYHYIKKLGAKNIASMLDADGDLEYLECSLLDTKIRFIREDHKFEATKKLLKESGAQKILFADICPHRDMLITCADHFDEVLVLDHHISAQKECGDLPYTYFDMNRSGAGIVWDWFCKDELGVGRPLLIDLIEDRDIWKWKVPNAKELLLVIEMYRRTFPEWDKISARLTDHYDECVAEGKSYLRYHNKVIGILGSPNKVHKLLISNYVIPAINCNFYQSELGSNLAEANKLKTAAIYYCTGKGWNISLRSSKDGGLDVSELAKLYGGGGHKNAAAFRVEDINELSPSEFTEEELHNILTVSFSN
jgi:oligoribonuclease NrnB/cAMP/cGMP phosphodiesterase (DHH superfamily)